MKFQEQNFTLKNGKNIIIREAIVQDAESIIKLAKKCILDSEHLLMTVDEFNPTIEEEEKWIKSFIDNKNYLLLVATYNNEIIGNIDLTAINREKLKHNGIIGMEIEKEWRGLGLGYLLLDSLIKWVKQKSELSKINLDVFSSNENAIALYKKVGFIEEGRQSKFIKIKENEFVDNLIMGLEINRL
ncbi:MAG: GNAT family N-acetyltransferase [Candidatus Sericytochromatia bacterium]